MVCSVEIKYGQAWARLGSGEGFIFYAGPGHTNKVFVKERLRNFSPYRTYVSQNSFYSRYEASLSISFNNITCFLDSYSNNIVNTDKNCSREIFKMEQDFFKNACTDFFFFRHEMQTYNNTICVLFPIYLIKKQTNNTVSITIKIIQNF